MIALLFLIIYIIIIGILKEIFIRKGIGYDQYYDENIFSWLMAIFWPVCVPFLTGKILVEMFSNENKENK